MKVRIEKLEIAIEQLENLPIFYDQISYIKMRKGDPHFHYHENLQSFINYGIPEKPLSKIIDLTLINQ